MGTKRSSIRPFGQLSLSSAFLFNSSSKDCKENIQAGYSRRSISLSDFLDRKLDKNTQKSVKEQHKVFSSFGSGVNGFVSDKLRGTEKVEQNNIINADMFRQFKHSGIEGNCSELPESKTTSHLHAVDRQDSRKRKLPISRGEIEHSCTSSYMVVLGDDPKPKQKGMEARSMNKRTKSLFNHYASGGGWWDCDMEGLDSEEVGCSEVWEGLGSTTLGGLEFH